MYKFKEAINYDHYFWWKKNLIKNMEWALLPKSSKSVFPVIACHANSKGIAFPSEQTIAILAGISEKTAREGIRKLEGFSSFSFDYYISNRRKRIKKYKLKLPSKENRESAFPFYKSILEGGFWHQLKNSSKAVYPVMRYFGFFDFDIYAELEDIELEHDEYEDLFKNRNYDFCDVEINIMAQYSGLHRNSINSAIDDLEKKLLIELLKNVYGWKVFLKLDRRFDRAYLNNEILKSYRHKL